MKKNSSLKKTTKSQSARKCSNLSKRAFTFTWALVAVCLVIVGQLFVVSSYPNHNGLILPDTQQLNENDHNDNRKSNDSKKPALMLSLMQEKPALEPVNLLVLGFDKDGYRTDTIMLINYAPDRNSMNLLSIPRDLYVKLDGNAMKVNEVFSHGGVPYVKRVVQTITGINPDYFITIDFDGFKEIVDVLGGVEFDVPFSMIYDDPYQNLHIYLKRGKQVLNGKKAEQIIRYRKSNKAGVGYKDGDLGRIKMQQAFLREMIKQKLKLKYLSKIDDIYWIIKRYVQTDVKLADIYTYIPYLKQFDAQNINTFSLPGEDAYFDSLFYFLYDKKTTQEIIEKYFK